MDSLMDWPFDQAAISWGNIGAVIAMVTAVASAYYALKSDNKILKDHMKRMEDVLEQNQVQLTKLADISAQLASSNTALTLASARMDRIQAQVSQLEQRFWAGRNHARSS